MSNKKVFDDLKSKGEIPTWMEIEGFLTLSNGYLLENETPRGMYRRVSKSASLRLNRPDLEERFFEIMWKGWLGLASPVSANMGTERGLPISCYSSYFPDSIDGIMSSMYEIAMLSKNGGGIGTYFGDIRPRGCSITNNGKTDGILPFLKILDSTTVGISQGGTRRGASASYISIEHGDFDEFVDMRRPKGDANRQCLNIHHGVCISNEFMERVEDGDEEARRRWKKLLKTRFETGEPYIFFSDNVNEQNPQCYKDLGLEVKASNLCSEIVGYIDQEHTFVCCLSSLNLEKWDEWKDTDTIELSIYFLDAVMEEFIQKAKLKRGFEKAVRFAEKSRMLGLGTLGFHSLLQSKRYSFDDLRAYTLNGLIFKTIRERAEMASRELAKEYGEPEWCKGYGFRNSHLLAMAPTVSNSTICSTSPSIEPIVANAYTQKTAKGTFLRKNKYLEEILGKYAKNSSEIWKSIITNEGSVQHLDFLTEEEKKVFLTAREINQFDIIKLASQRQKYIDQAQSLNLFFPANTDPKYFNKVHIEAWKSGLKTLYYCRSSSVLRGDAGSKEYKREIEECSSCSG